MSECVRRDFISMLTGGSAFALLGTLLGPAVSDDLKVLGQKPSLAGDKAFLNAAIQLEQKAINTYEAAVRADLIKKPNNLDVVADFVADHGHHRDKLSRVLRKKFSATPPLIEKLGSFPIPESVLKGKEADVVRYALTLEMIASKTYFEAAKDRLMSDEARAVVASILPVEMQHVAAYRTLLMSVLKDKALPEDRQLVPFPLFSAQPNPEH